MELFVCVLFSLTDLLRFSLSGRQPSSQVLGLEWFCRMDVVERGEG